MLDDNLKFCTGCKTDKAKSEYAKNKRTHDGLQTLCKKCQYAKNALYDKINKDKKYKRQAKYLATEKGYGAIKRYRENWKKKLALKIKSKSDKAITIPKVKRDAEYLRIKESFRRIREREGKENA